MLPTATSPPGTITLVPIAIRALSDIQPVAMGSAGDSPSTANPLCGGYPWLNRWLPLEEAVGSIVEQDLHGGPCGIALAVLRYNHEAICPGGRTEN